MASLWHRARRSDTAKRVVTNSIVAEPEEPTRFGLEVRPRGDRTHHAAVKAGAVLCVHLAQEPIAACPQPAPALRRGCGR